MGDDVNQPFSGALATLGRGNKVSAKRRLRPTVKKPNALGRLGYFGAKGYANDAQPYATIVKSLPTNGAEPNIFANSPPLVPKPAATPF